MSKLTIAIPTFNRSVYLRRCLNSIAEQDIAYRSFVSVLVADNCSEDQTKSVVDEFILEGLPIQYIRHDSNIGPDNNIGFCYLAAKTNYVLVFGDDDVFLPDSFNLLKHILEKHEDAGVIFLNFYGFVDDYLIAKSNKNAYRYRSEEILKYIVSNVSFISANIVATKYISTQLVNSASGTYLNQIPVVLNAISNSESSIFINSYLIAQQTGNSGEFNLKYFKIFGANFPLVVNTFSTISSKSKFYLFHHLLIKIFPSNLYSMKRRENFSDLEEAYSVLKSNFDSYGVFWWAIYPIYKLPGILSLLYLILVKIYGKIYYSFPRHTGELIRINKAK